MTENDPTDKKYFVYIHIVPSTISGYDHDKYYVGITFRKPIKRWGKNGNGYNSQPFYNAIKKYGWDNIEHEIIASNLTSEEAKSFEISLIKLLNSRNPKNGYNRTDGGDGTTNMPVTDKMRKARSLTMKNLWENEESRNKILKMISENSKLRWQDPVYRENQTRRLKSYKPLKGKDHPNSRQIVLLNTGEVFDCEIQAAEKYNIHQSMMHKYCNQEANCTILDDNGKPLTWAYLCDYQNMTKDDIYNRIELSSQFLKKSKKSDPFVCLNTGEVFEYTFLAEEKYNILKSNIMRCCNGGAKSCGILPSGEKLTWTVLSKYQEMSQEEKNEKIKDANSVPIRKDIRRFIIDTRDNIIFSCISICSNYTKIPKGTLYDWISLKVIPKSVDKGRFRKYTDYLEENNLNHIQVINKFTFIQ